MFRRKPPAQEIYNVGIRSTEPPRNLRILQNLPHEDELEHVDPDRPRPYNWEDDEQEEELEFRGIAKLSRAFWHCIGFGEELGPQTQQQADILNARFHRASRVALAFTSMAVLIGCREEPAAPVDPKPFVEEKPSGINPPHTFPNESILPGANSCTLEEFQQTGCPTPGPTIPPMP